jgi:hypothetical protein
VSECFGDRARSVEEALGGGLLVALLHPDCADARGRFAVFGRDRCCNPGCARNKFGVRERPTPRPGLRYDGSFAGSWRPAGKDGDSGCALVQAVTETAPIGEMNVRGAGLYDIEDYRFLAVADSQCDRRAQLVGESLELRARYVLKAGRNALGKLSQADAQDMPSVGSPGHEPMLHERAEQAVDAGPVRPEARGDLRDG